MSSWAKNFLHFFDSGKKRLLFSAVLAAGFCSVFLPAKGFAAAVFEIPPYKSVIFNCTSGGCCTQPMDSLVQQMFRGIMLYSGQQDLQQYYYLSDLKPSMRSAYKDLSDDLRNSTFLSAALIGSFLDAQTFEQALLSLQKQTTTSLQTETASDQICRLGTLSRSLAQSEDKAKLVQLNLAMAMLNRETLQENMNAAFEEKVGRSMGRGADKVGRIAQLKEFFCDPADHSSAVASVCTAKSDAVRNRDISSLRTLFAPQTLDLDFSGSKGATPTADERSLFALANNLFAHDLSTNFGKADLDGLQSADPEVVENRIGRLHDFRSLIAKRSVAQNSFAALAGMKAAGSGSVGTYMKEMLREMGLDANSQLAQIGNNPSYDAQMTMLTRTLYQSPSFYANLMESTTNVARQQSAMESIGLMQDRDIYDSMRRSEMLLSTLLETYIAQSQDALADRGTKGGAQE